jgi:hypothetical protein
MATYIGDAGGIAVGAETVYGTETAAWVIQNAVSASFGARRALIETNLLNATYPSIREFNRFSDGELVVGYSRKRATNLFLGTIGTLATQTYTFGAGTAPTNAIGLSALVDYGGYQVKYLGCTVSKLRWELAALTTVKQTATLIGRAGAKDITPETITVPDIANVQMDSDLATFTLGTAVILIKGATIEVDANMSGLDRRGLGSADHRQPVCQGSYTITASLQCELSTDTTNDTVAQLDDFLAGTTVGDLAIDDWTLLGCYMTGDMPALQAGILSFPINVRANTMTLLTEA